VALCAEETRRRVYFLLSRLFFPEAMRGGTGNAAHTTHIGGADNGGVFHRGL